MTTHEARAIHRAVERAGIPARLVEHLGGRATIALLAIYAYDLDDVMEVFKEHYADDDAAYERLSSETEASGTFDQRPQPPNLPKDF